MRLTKKCAYVGLANAACLGFGLIFRQCGQPVIATTLFIEACLLFTWAMYDICRMRPIELKGV